MQRGFEGRPQGQTRLILNVAAADDALGVGEQDNLQENGGRIGGCARFIVAEAGIETGEIEFVVDQVIHGVFEGAGKELSLQINGEKPGAGVDVSLTRHLHLQEFVPRFDLDIYFGSRHDAV